MSFWTNTLDISLDYYGSREDEILGYLLDAYNKNDTIENTIPTNASSRKSNNAFILLLITSNSNKDSKYPYIICL